MALVAAHAEITGNNFTIARKGDEGRAIPKAKPHEPGNWNKVLVFFRGNKHGYWCDPNLLTFETLDPGCGVEDYIAIKEELDCHSSLPVMRRREEFDYHFGDNLRMYRKARGLTQAEMGKRMGEAGVSLAQSTICYREKSSHSPSGKFVQAAAEALGVPPFALFMPITNCKFFASATKFVLGVSSAMCTEDQ